VALEAMEGDGGGELEGAIIRCVPQSSKVGACVRLGAVGMEMMKWLPPPIRRHSLGGTL